MLGLLGKKLGMTRFFGKNGASIAATIIEAGPCYVTQIKTRDKEGYNAIQLGFGSKREKLVKKPEDGHFKRAGVEPTRYLKEFREPELKSIKEGDEIKVDIFKEGDSLTISGVSKGKGFAGAVKRYGFKGGPKTRGQSDRLRAPGSIGASSFPSRVFKGKKMPGRMGNRRVTVRNLEILKVDPEKNLLIVKGAVPGPINGMLEIRKM